MTKDLHKMTSEELGRLFPVVISESKLEWKTLFLQKKEEIIALLGKEVACRVEHIGSTAVSNLAAKPTIDMLVEIPKGAQIENDIIRIMTANNYDYMREAHHLMFVQGYTPEGFKGQCYHIHMGPKDDDNLWDRLYFRDYLIEYPDIADEYAALKKELEQTFKYDRDGYTSAKADFIKCVTERAKKEFVKRPFSLKS